MKVTCDEVILTYKKYGFQQRSIHIQFTLSGELRELSLIIRIVNRARPESITDRESDIILVADVQDVIPMCVGKILLVMREAPFRMDGATPGHNPRHPSCRQGDEPQQNTSMDGEVVHTLLRLLQKSFPEHLPRQILGNSIHFLKCLVDRDGSNRNRRVSHNPFSRFVNMDPRREVHYRVSTPHCRPLQLLNLLLDGARDRGVADVGVHLDEELAADDHRLELQVPLVGGDDGAAAGHFGADELRIHLLAGRAVGHLLRHNALLRVVHLRVALVLACLPLLNPFLPKLRQTCPKTKFQNFSI